MTMKPSTIVTISAAVLAAATSARPLDISDNNNNDSREPMLEIWDNTTPDSLVDYQGHWHSPFKPHPFQKRGLTDFIDDVKNTVSETWDTVKDWTTPDWGESQSSTHGEAGTPLMPHSLWPRRKQPHFSNGGVQIIKEVGHVGGLGVSPLVTDSVRKRDLKGELADGLTNFFASSDVPAEIPVADP